MQSVEGPVVAITGGTGSFGPTIARDLLSRGAHQDNIFSHDEAKQDEMRRRFADERLPFFLNDVRGASSVAPAMRKVDSAFYNAELKQVPSYAFFPRQAVLTNVTGSDKVIKAATGAGVRSLVSDAPHSMARNDAWRSLFPEVIPVPLESRLKETLSWLLEHA